MNDTLPTIHQKYTVILWCTIHTETQKKLVPLAYFVMLYKHNFLVHLALISFATCITYYLRECSMKTKYTTTTTVFYHVRYNMYVLK